MTRPPDETVPPPTPDVTPDAATEAAVGRAELIISRLLRVGVMTSLAIVVVGLALTFARNPSYDDRSGPPVSALVGDAAAFPHTFAGVFHDALRLRGPGVTVLGLLLLIATPVLRVAVSVCVFAAQRDRAFTAITSLVLLLLVISFLLGKAG